MSKEQKEKIPRDASWPEWYDGKTISETGFCEDFLESHPMKCINGRLFTVNGPVEDEEQINVRFWRKSSRISSPAFPKR